MSLYISPERFKRFMEWLKRGGYSSALPSEWDERAATNRRVILTFDDAYEDFMSNAFPVLNRLGLKATVFVENEDGGQYNISFEEKESTANTHE